LLPEFGKYANHGAWRAEHCEYFRIKATAVTIITSMGSGQRKAKAPFFHDQSESQRGAEEMG
jgi:hypothetical protein